MIEEAAEIIKQQEIPQYITQLTTWLERKQENLESLNHLHQLNDLYTKQTLRSVSDEFDQLITRLLETKKRMVESLRSISHQSQSYLQSLITSETYHTNDLKSSLAIASQLSLHLTSSSCSSSSSVASAVSTL